jgi:acetyl-CoA carboxylase alpha subunit
MRKRRADGRFVRGPGVGAEKVLVEVERVGGTETGTTKELPAAPRSRYCRTYTRNRVAEALPDIVEKFVEQAKLGSVPHAKALAALGGLDKGDVIPAVVRRRGKSLGRQLMEEFGDPPPQE